mgnify:CR=1 FL=1
MAMLEVKDLNVYYGMIQAIKGISFEVPSIEKAGIVTCLSKRCLCRHYFLLTIHLLIHLLHIISSIPMMQDSKDFLPPSDPWIGLLPVF